MSNVGRRQYLHAVSAAIGSAALTPMFIGGASAAAAVGKEDVLLGGCRFRDSPEGEEKFSLTRVVPNQNTITRAQTTFFPHGLAFTDGSLNAAYAFEKIGPGAALFDLENMRELAVIPPVKNRLFYGHGVCSPDGKLLYSTETAPTGEGAIGVRETSGLAYLGDFPTYGSHPHECHLTERGSVLVVTNGGGTKDSGQRASICYIDVRSQRLLERIEMPHDEFNAGHLFPLPGHHQSILVSAPRRGWGDDHLGGISVRLGTKALKVLAAPREVVSNMFGEALSVVAIPAADLFVVTHPKPGMVTFWRLSTLELQKRVELPGARGLSLANNGTHIWVSFGSQAALVRVSIANLEFGAQMTQSYITGSHLFAGGSPATV